MGTYYKTAIALGVALAFSASNAALAKEKDWKFHEDNWQEVMSYGKVPIANESTGEWGPWAEFAQPFAGPMVNVALLGEPTGDPYRPLPGVNTPPTTPTEPPNVCPAGFACGYAIYMNYTDPKHGDPYIDGPKKGYKGPYPATFIASAEFNNTGEWNAYVKEQVQVWHPGYWHWGHYYPGYYTTETQKVNEVVGEKGTVTGNFAIASTNPADPAPKLTESGNLSGTYKVSTTTATLYYYDSVFGSTLTPGEGAGSAQRSDSQGGAYIQGYTSGQPIVTGTDGQVGLEGYHNPYLVYDFKIYQYTSCGYGCDRPSEGVIGTYIAGIPTTLEQIAGLPGGLKVGTYAGTELNNPLSQVNINVNFNSASWNGTWSGTGYAGGGNQSWNAAGNISGQNIQSTSVGGTATGGSVQGTFYGPQAQALGGVSDVTGGFAGGRHVDLFTTQRVTPPQ